MLNAKNNQFFNRLQSAHHLDYLNTRNFARGQQIMSKPSIENTKKRQMKFYYCRHTYNRKFSVCIKMRSSLLTLKSRFKYFAMAAAAINIIIIITLCYDHQHFVRHWFSVVRILISALNAIEKYLRLSHTKTLLNFSIFKRIHFKSTHGFFSILDAIFIVVHWWQHWLDDDYIGWHHANKCTK